VLTHTHFVCVNFFRFQVGVNQQPSMFTLNTGLRNGAAVRFHQVALDS